MRDFMRLTGARTNNLKNITVDIPLKKMTVVTGVSGSGKSSLVFDTLFAEGQRRYVESLSTYTRQFLEKLPKPDIDSLDHVPPAVALEQKNTINNSRSTVATMSEIYDYLRLLYSKVGHVFCTSCGKEVRADSPGSIAENLASRGGKLRLYVLAPLGIVASPLAAAKKGKSAKTKVKAAKAASAEAQMTTLDRVKSLRAQGFERVMTEAGEVLEIPEIIQKPETLKTDGELFVVIDRIASGGETSKADPRLLDALENAFSQGNGRVALGIVGDKGIALEMYSDRFRCDACGIDYKKPEPLHFSFNSPLGACSACSGFGYNLELDESLVVPDPRKTLKNGAVDPFTKPASEEWQTDLFKFCDKHKIGLGKRYNELTKEEKDLIWNGDGTGKGFPGIVGCFEEMKRYKYKLHVRVFIRRYQTQKICLTCHGARLNKDALATKVSGYNIAEVLRLSIEKASGFFAEMKLTPFEKKIAKDIFREIDGRLNFLNEVGVGYLTLDRLAKTLSGGECQRINLATQLGSKLCSTLYVLDEPSIGLHAADTERLIGLLHRLRDHGNTVVVVEHDLDVIASADNILEIGPGAGRRGGELIAAGPLQQIVADKGCLTAKYLTGVFSLPPRETRRAKRPEKIRIEGACENNLKSVDVDFPLHQLVAVTGISGSGKTTLVHRTLYNALARLFHRENLPVGKFHKIFGADLIRDVVLLDQSPIGRNARSNPATYMKIWDEVRKIYANQSTSIRRGLTPGHFSFNVDGGRCPVCKGEGEISLDMHFMADIKIPCDECHGKRFKKSVLEIEFKKKNVDDLLQTTIEECVELFRDYPAVARKLQILKNVGLGYLELGQPSTTLSGGESQRLKIASVLEEHNSSGVLYIFDEPTTGLHVDDVKRLVQVLHDLVDNRNSVIVIEHNLELISQADWVVDIGPRAGEHGGEVVAIGTPEEIMENKSSLTGKFLQRVLKSKSRMIRPLEPALTNASL